MVPLVHPGVGVRETASRPARDGEGGKKDKIRDNVRGKPLKARERKARNIETVLLIIFKNLPGTGLSAKTPSKWTLFQGHAEIDRCPEAETYANN